MAEAKINHLRVIDDWECKTPTGRDERWKFLDVTHGKDVFDCKNTPDSAYIRILNDERNLPPNRNLQDKETTKIYSGAANRQAFADATRKIMEERSLSFRKAAEVSGLTPTKIQRVVDMTATIEIAIDVVSKLGGKVSLDITSG